jgi:hypothetical protein
MPRTASPGSEDRRSRRLRWATLVAGGATALTPLVAVPLVAEAASTPVVRWSDTDVRVGVKVVATVDPGSLPRGTSPVLQRKFPDAWREADGRARRTDAGLRLRVPTDQYGRFRYRVVATSRSGVVSASPSSPVAVRPTYDPRGRRRHYEFLDAQRIRWDSCRVVRWKFNGDLAPRRGLKQVKAAVRRIHAASGIEFVYAGRSDRKANPYGKHIAGAAVVIGWRSAQTFRRRVHSTQVVGLAGQQYVGGYRDAQGPVSRTTQGGVILNAGHRLATGFGRGTTWGEVIVHELGHVMGLGHIGAPTQVMYFSTTGRDANLGAGDLNGLRQLGDTRGCLQRTSGRATTGSRLSR